MYKTIELLFLQFSANIVQYVQLVSKYFCNIIMDSIIYNYSVINDNEYYIYDILHIIY